MVIIPETQDRKGHWGHRPSRLFPAVRGGAAGRPVAMARPGWRARCPDLQAQDARLGRGSGSVLSEVPCSVWAARGVWVLSVGPRVRQGRHNRPPFPRARGRCVGLGDRAAQAPPWFQGFRVPASNRPHACRPPGAMAGGAPWGSPRSAVTLQPRAAGAAASTPRTRKLRLELRACSDRTRATRRRGAGLACGRHPPPQEHGAHRLCPGATQTPCPGRRPPTLLPAPPVPAAQTGQRDTRPAHQVSAVATPDRASRPSSTPVLWGLSKAPELCTRPGHAGGRWRHMP